MTCYGKYIRWSLVLFWGILIGWPNPGLGQMQISRTLDVGAGLADGSILATVEPGFTTNTIANIFDGNHLTSAVNQASDSIRIRLQFDHGVTLSKSKLFAWVAGTWKLELADAAEDLQNRTGSYRLLVPMRNLNAFAWDSTSFTPATGHFIQLTVKNPSGPGIYLGEWTMLSSVTMTALEIQPRPLMMIPGTSLQLKVLLVDGNGKTYPYDLPQPVQWLTSDPTIATIGEMGDIRAHAIGTCVISAKIQSISGSSTLEVIADFESPKAEPLRIKVALVLQNPIIDFTRNRKINQVRSWTDPMVLVNQLMEEFSRISGGVVQFEIVESHDDQMYFTRLDGELMSIDTVAYYYSSNSRLYGRDTPGTLQNLAEIQGRVWFDYNAMIDYYDFATKRNNDVIHEVWVYAAPFGGMAESQLLGPNAFWYNSSPKQHQGLNKLLSVMGWNYERGIAEALESFGHRSESALVHTFGDRWNVFAENPTAWEIYTRINKDFPGRAQVGNIHYPPNGLSDYDFGNRAQVNTYADNWKRYPILLDQVRSITCQEWGCSHVGYMRWWFSHLPRYQGVSDGVLNNWWHYIVDYEGAVALASQMTGTKESRTGVNSVPESYRLEQNYPNPFNNYTWIAFTLPEAQQISLKLYNIQGQELKTVLNEKKPAGRYQIKLAGDALSSGMYFYRLKAGSYHQIRKMLLLK